VVTIAATDGSAGEAANSGLFTVTASPAPTSALTVNLARGGSATNGSDYSNIATTISVGSGGTATIPVSVLNDQLLEGSETVSLTVLAGTGYSVGAANAATVTITDDDTGVIATAANGFFNTALTPGQTGTFTATFYATPSHSLSDAIIGLANPAPAAYTDVAAVARFNPSGNIDARNGGAYAAVSTIPYTGGLTYAFRMVVNVATRTYSIFVTPPGGSELTVGTNYAFRTEQASVTSLNNWTAQIATPTGASLMVTNFAVTAAPPTNLLSHGTFEPTQATVLQDMPTQFILGTHAANIWQGRVGAVSSQNTTYQTSGTNHYIAVGASANGPGAFQVISWPGTGTRTLTFQYRGSLAAVKIFGGNTGATIEKFSGSNTLTLLQTITKSSVSVWTAATHTITLTGSYNYLVIQLKGGDYDDLSITP
jgi:hypothetical protein